MASAVTDDLMHASAVAVGPTGLLIRGESGSGKSELAMQLVALGAELVADDQVRLTRKDGGLLMSCPAALKDRIEARGLGILACPTREAWARFVVDLDQVVTDRLPEPRQIVIGDLAFPSLGRVESAAFPSMLYLLLQGGMA